MKKYGSQSRDLRARSICVAATVTLALAAPSVSCRVNKPFETATAIDVIEELSSEAYHGRLAGTPDGAKAGDYIASRLSEAGISVGFQESPMWIPQLIGTPKLTLIDASGERSDFLWREGFREFFWGGCAGTDASGPLVRIVDKPTPERMKGAIVLTKRGPDDSDVARFRLWEEMGAVGIIVLGLPGEIPRLQPATTLTQIVGPDVGKTRDPARGITCLLASERGYDVLSQAARSGARSIISSPVKYSKGFCRNVIGTWNGDGGALNPKIIFSAHYDHAGTDPDGSHYPGAVDNASGTAVVIALAQTIAASRAKGEGSFKVAHGLNGAGAKLAGEMRAFLKEKGITSDVKPDYVWSDNLPFSFAGIEAVTLVDERMTGYHTKADTIDLVSAEEITQLGQALLEFAFTRM